MDLSYTFTYLGPDRASTIVRHTYNVGVMIIKMRYLFRASINAGGV
jgi:hypothetical protein